MFIKLEARTRLLPFWTLINSRQVFWTAYAVINFSVSVRLLILVSATRLTKLPE